MTTTQKLVADGGVVVATSVAGMTWITNLNAILQLIATAVAIMAGLASAWYYYTKARALKKGQ